MGLDRSVSGILQVSTSFVWQEVFEQFAASAPRSLDCSLGSFAHQVLEFGEHLLDRVRIPTQTSRGFPCIPACDSDGSQPVIPIHSSTPEGAGGGTVSLQ